MKNKLLVIQDNGGQHTLLFGNNNWYLFLRLHRTLYERLSHFHEQAQLSLEEQTQARLRESVESTAVALGLKPPRKNQSMSE